MRTRQEFLARNFGNHAREQISESSLAVDGRKQHLLNRGTMRVPSLALLRQINIKLSGQRVSLSHAMRFPRLPPLLWTVCLVLRISCTACEKSPSNVCPRSALGFRLRSRCMAMVKSVMTECDYLCFVAVPPRELQFRRESFLVSEWRKWARNKSTRRMYIATKYPAVDKRREWSFAVEIHSVVIVGGDDDDEGDQERHHYA